MFLSTSAYTGNTLAKLALQTLMRRTKTAGLAALFIFAVSYFMTSTSAPISIARTILVYWYEDLTTTSSFGNLLLGSSSIRRLDSSKYLRCGNWANRGIGSSTIPNIETYLKYSQSDIKPKNILIYGGENDLQDDKYKDRVFTTYVSLLENLSLKYPEALIHIVAIKPSMKRKDNWTHFVAVNSSLKTYSESHKHILFHEPEWLEVYESGMDRETNAWFLEDGIHLSNAGYLAFAGPVNTNCLAI